MPWFLSNRIFSNVKNALGFRRIQRHDEGDTGHLDPSPDFRGLALPPTQNSFSEVVHIAVINSKALAAAIKVCKFCCNRAMRYGLSSLNSAKRTTRSFVKLLSAFVRWISELHKFSDQVRIFTVKHRITIPCQRIFKAIEIRHNSFKKIFKQLFAIGHSVCASIQLYLGTLKRHPKENT